jgi:hypothetical protein
MSAFLFPEMGRPPTGKQGRQKLLFFLDKNAADRAGIRRLFDAVLVSGHVGANLGLFGIVVETEDFGAQLDTGLAAYTFIGVYGHFQGHGDSPLVFVVGISCLPSLLLNERLPTLSFRPQGEISGGKVRDFSLSLEMTGNYVSSIFAHQQCRYFASGSSN